MAISETARIAPGAEIGREVNVGDFTIVGPDVTLGDRSVVESHCLLGYETPLAAGRLRIGAQAHIRSHSVLYRGSSFGPGLVTGHHVTVRERTVAGVRLQLGTMTDLQGHTRIGDHVRTHSSVFIPKHTTIGSYVWLFPSVVLTNDRQPPSEGSLLGPCIDDFAVVAANATVLAGVRIGRHAVVGAHSFVREDVEPYSLVAGAPASRLGDVREVRLADEPDRMAYPWTQRFHRGYPEEIVAGWGDAARGDPEPPP